MRTFGAILIAAGLLLTAGFAVYGAVATNRAAGEAADARDVARRVTARLQAQADRTCRERRANTKAANVRGRTVTRLMLEVDRPFLLGAANVRLSTAAVQEGQERKAEAILNRQAASEWKRLAQHAKRLAEMVPRYTVPVCK